MGDVPVFVFFDIRQAIKEYSADSLRFTLADAGDTVEDANFSTKIASDKAIMRLSRLITFVDEVRGRSLSEEKDWRGRNVAIVSFLSWQGVC